MNNINSIIDVALNKITKEEFLEINSIGISDISKVIKLQLLKANEDKDAELVEYAITVLFVFNVYDLDIDDIVCNLLQADWHHIHENLAIIIAKRKSPSTVDCLFRASQKQYSYLSYDDTYQFARKCIKALSAIGNSNALEKLKLLSESRNNIIKEYAKKELMYLGVK